MRDVFASFHLRFLICAISIAASPLAHAGSVAIPIHSAGAPAIDLTYRGEPIDRDDAIDLANQGIDLSQLEPVPSDAWQPKSFPAREDASARGYPAEGATVRFDSSLPSSGGLFRSRVLSGNPQAPVPFQLLMSLSGHASLARAALLRRLGYPVPSPRRYAALTVTFATIADRDSFLDSLSDATLTARKRWVRSLPDKDASVTLQDVVLEPAQIDVPMYHWGIVPASALKGRRVVRSLIVPLTLLDVQESVNLYSWETGKTINDSVIFTHPYAESFQEATYEDARWIARKISRLSRADFAEIVAAGAYPDDVAALVTEKLIARRDHLVEMFELSSELPRAERKLPYNNKITQGAVIKGKETRSDYDGYALRFTYGDPEDPLRKSEYARYLLVEALGAALTGALEQGDTYLQAQTASQVQQKHQGDLLTEFYQFAHDHPGVPYTAPVGAWGGPVGGLSVNASRNVVSGTYFGSESQVQLVDLLSVEASLGFYMGFDGVPKVIPSVNGNMSLQRSYLHVRPLADMKSALKSDWTDILVPKYMAGLKKLVSKDGPADQRLKEFLDTLKEGEMLVITDSLLMGVQAGVTIPIPVLMNPALTVFNPSVGISGGAAPTMLTRTTLVRTKDGIQVYLQKANILNIQAELDFNWIINLIKLNHFDKRGNDVTQAYLLDQQPSSSDDSRKMLTSLKALFTGNDSEVLAENFQDYQLKHQMTTQLNKASLLWYRWGALEERHRVKVSPPGHPEAVRTLYSDKVMQTMYEEPINYLGTVLSGAGSLVSKTAASLVPTPSTSSMGTSTAFLGTNQWTAVTSEAEITPGKQGPSDAIVEQHWGGWSLDQKHLYKVLDKIELEAREVNADRPLIRRDEFATMKRLEMYDISSNLIVYESGLKKLGELLFAPGGVDETVRELTAIEGQKDLDAWCDRPFRKLADKLLHVHSYTVKEGGKKHHFACLKPWMKEALKVRHKVLAHKSPESSEQQVQMNSKVVRDFMRKADFAKVLNWLGKENYFLQIKVSGFRTGDENGDTEYVSDSVGSFNDDQGGGVFREFASKYGIMTNEIEARYLGDGF